MTDSYGVDIPVVLKAPALEKLIDYAACGIGSIAGPMLAPWKARRRAKAVEITAAGDAAAQRILASAEADKLELIAEARANALAMHGADDLPPQRLASAEELIAEGWRFQEQKRQHNIRSVLEAAATDLGDEEVPDRDPNLDWTARFFRDVQDVSTAEMQHLWSRVLAAEVRQTNSTSLRTLEILRSLDPRVAKVFARFCSLTSALAVDANIDSLPTDFLQGYYDARRRKLILDQRVISLEGDAAKNNLSAYGLGFGTLTVLNEYGLVISDLNSWHEYSSCVLQPNETNASPFVLLHGEHAWKLRCTGDKKDVKSVRLSGVMLSNAGRELASVVDLEVDETYQSDLREYLAQKNLQLVQVVYPT